MNSERKLSILEYKINLEKKNDLKAMTFNIVEVPDKSEPIMYFPSKNERRYYYIDILPLDFSRRNSIIKKKDSDKIVGMGWILDKNVRSRKRNLVFNKLIIYKHLNFCHDLEAFNQKKRIQKWANYLNFDKDKLKQLCIYGIPNEIRGEVWCYFLGSKKMLYSNSNIYLEKLNEKIDKSTLNQITLDLNRTFPNSKFYNISSESNIICELEKVLKAFASFDSEIGYCQSINFIVAALLINMKEEIAFWTLVQLISSKRRSEHMNCNWNKIEDYYKDGMKGIIRDINVLKKLCEKVLPKIFYKLKDIGVDIQWFALEWFLCFFTTSFPVLTAMNILDFIFCFGNHTLFNISIALLDLNKSKILSSTDTEECMIIIKSLTKKTTNPSKILRRAIKYDINQIYIDELRKQVSLGN